MYPILILNLFLSSLFIEEIGDKMSLLPTKMCKDRKRKDKIDCLVLERWETAVLMGDCCLESEEGWCTYYLFWQRIPLTDCFRKETILVSIGK